MLVKLDGFGSTSVLEGFTKRLRRIPASLRKTLTYDQGSEMAQHETLAKRLHSERPAAPPCHSRSGAALGM